MGLAHKGSRLSLKDQPVYAEYDSTHLNFDMDATGISTGELIEPLEGSIYTHRKGEGRFNSAVAVEEGTTNLMSAPFFEKGNPTQVVGTSSLKQEVFNLNGVEIQGVTLTQGITTDRIVIATPPITGIASGQSFTVSILFKSTKPNPLKCSISCNIGGTTYYLNDSDVWSTTVSESTRIFAGYTNIGNWQRVSYFIPALPAGTVVDFRVTGFYRLTDSFVASLANMQIERKDFPTSFTVGTRSAGKLEYPLGNTINPSSGTITMWFNPLSRKPQQFPAIFALGGWVADNSRDWISIYHGSGWGNGNTMQFTYTNGAIKKNVDTALMVNPLPYNWYFIAFSWDIPNGVGYCSVTEQGTDRKIEQVINLSQITSPATLAGETRIYIGSNSANSTVNSMYSDIMIDKYALSEEEIERRYISNKAIYNPYDYRAYGV